jgi:hypothetical protein
MMKQLNCLDAGSAGGCGSLWFFITYRALRNRATDLREVSAVAPRGYGGDRTPHIIESVPAT